MRIFIILMSVYSLNCRAQGSLSYSPLAASEFRAWKYVLGGGLGTSNFSQNGEALNNRYGNPLTYTLDFGFLMSAEPMLNFRQGGLLRIILNPSATGGLLKARSSHLSSVLMGYHFTFRLPAEKYLLRGAAGIYAFSWGDSEQNRMSGVETQNNFSSETQLGGFLGLGYESKFKNSEVSYQYFLDMVAGKTGASVVGPVSAVHLLGGISLFL